ncbi:MAG: prohibitin family protein [Anaerolineae bacterium]|nr:prohibitin family protein [Anaerolineae bacterium]
MGFGSLINTLSLVGGLAFLGGIALAVLSSSQGRPPRNGILLAVIGLVIFGLFAIVGQGILVVQPQEVAVVFNSLTGNVEDEPRGAGTSIVIPGVQEYTLYRIDQQEYTMSGTTNEGARAGDDVVRARTRDGQEVGLDVTIIFAVEPTDADQVHVRWRDRYVEDFVRPTARSFVRDVISGYTAEEIYGSGRTEMEQQIQDLLLARMAEEGLKLNDLLVRDITFSDQFSQSIENAQIAQQEAARARLVVQQREQEAAQARAVAAGERDAAITRAEGEAQAIILRAQAEAEALRLVSEQIAANPALIQYQYIQTLADNISLALIPSNSPFLFDFESIAANPDFVAPEVPDVVTPEGGS